MDTLLYTVPKGFFFANIKRLTKEYITKANRNSLGLDVVFKRSLTQLTADTRLLVATEWQLPVKSVVGVDPDSSSAERICDLNGSGQAGGMDSGGKTVSAVVANLDNIGLVLELGDGADRAKDLFLLDLHVLGDIGEDGRLDEVTLVALALTASLNGSSGLLALLNVAIIAISSALKGGDAELTS